MSESLIEAIDTEIKRLKQARALLSGDAPKKAYSTGRPKRVLSPEARARIAAAQKKRWAKVKSAK